MDDGLKQILAWVFFIVGLPLLVLLLLHAFVKKPVMRLLDRILGAGGSSWTVSRTINLSAGSEADGTLRWSSTMPAAGMGGVQVAPGSEVDEDLGGRLRGEDPDGAPDPESVRRFREAWRAIEAKAADDPAQAVRDAHALVFELARRRGRPAVLGREERIEASGVTESLASLRDVLRRVQDAREAAHASERALAQLRVEPEALQKALREYRRLLDELLEPR